VGQPGARFLQRIPPAILASMTTMDRMKTGRFASCIKPSAVTIFRFLVGRSGVNSKSKYPTTVGSFSYVRAAFPDGRENV